MRDIRLRLSRSFPSRFTIALGALSILFTYAFFYEYLRPFLRVHVPGDLEEYHFPLADYAFQAVKHGRLPQWDPSNYAGMSFLANPQVQFYYPPLWLLFASRWGSSRMSLPSMEMYLFAHVWLAFALCYSWLRGKRRDRWPCMLAAGGYAFGGYMCFHLKNLGIACGYAWMPLALQGIDESIERSSARPLWKLTAALALCFLSGYPSMFFAILVLSGVYYVVSAFDWKSIGRKDAGWRSAGWKSAGWTDAARFGAAAALAVLLCAVQILPTYDATKLRLPERRYSGTREWVQWLAHVWPTYIDFRMGTPDPDPVEEYSYLGAPALIGAAVLLIHLARKRPSPVPSGPAAAVVAASIVVITDAGGIIGWLAERSPLLMDVCRTECFLAGVPLGMAALAAAGLQTLRPSLERLQPRLRTVVMIGTAILVAADLKFHGTSRRFDALQGVGQEYSDKGFTAMDDAAYRELLAHPDQRVLLDTTAPLPARLRHVGLQTPQGFDPFFPIQYRWMLQPIATFSDDREFVVDPMNLDALDRLAVRYVITSPEGKMHAALDASSFFRSLSSPAAYYLVYEYINAKPKHQWNGDGPVTVKAITPERRTYSVGSTRGGTLDLAEQFLPGWSATIDGVLAAIRPYRGAFQRVSVPPGEHVVTFTFSQPGLQAGAAISALALALLIWQSKRK